MSRICFSAYIVLNFGAIFWSVTEFSRLGRCLRPIQNCLVFISFFRRHHRKKLKEAMAVAFDQ